MARQTIGEFLAAQRKLKGYTQSQVAEKLGISNRTLSAWEQGRSYPDILTLPALAELYGVAVEDIVNGEKISSENRTQVVEQEPSENPQINLLKNSLARYRAKLALITGLGGIGPLLLTVFFVICNYTSIYVIVAASAEFVILVILLIRLFMLEKPVLRTGSNGRYLLAIKRATARCVLTIGLMWLACTVLFLAYTAVLVAYAEKEWWFEFVPIPCLPTAICLIAGALLSGRQKTDLTQSEKAVITENRKYMCVFSAICVGLALIISGVTTIVGSIDMVKVHEGVYEPKDEFIARYQSIRFTATDKYAYGLTTGDNVLVGDFFIDVAAVYAGPFTVSRDYGKVYHIDGELYLASDGLNWHEGSPCTVLYRQDIPEIYTDKYSEVASGRPMLLNGSELIKEYPNGGYEAIAEGKVVFLFNYPNSPDWDFSEKIHMINGEWAALKSVERFIEAGGPKVYRYVNRAVYSRKTFENAICGGLCAAAAAVCVGGYLVTRKRLDISL